jgi:rRNA-processing protein FCF1
LKKGIRVVLDTAALLLVEALLHKMEVTMEADAIGDELLLILMHVLTSLLALHCSAESSDEQDAKLRRESLKRFGIDRGRRETGVLECLRRRGAGGVVKNATVGVELRREATMEWRPKLSNWPVETYTWWQLGRLDCSLLCGPGHGFLLSPAISSRVFFLDFPIFSGYAR